MKIIRLKGKVRLIMGVIFGIVIFYIISRG